VDLDSLREAHLRAGRRRAAKICAALLCLAAVVGALGLWAAVSWRRADAERARTEDVVAHLTFNVVGEAAPYLPSKELLSVFAETSKYFEKREPGSLRARLSRAVSLAQMAGAVQHLGGDQDEALSLMKESEGLLEGIAKESPGCAPCAVERARTLARAGELLALGGRTEEAEAAYRRSVAVMEAEASRAPLPLRASGQLADSLGRLALLLAERKMDGAGGAADEWRRAWGEIMARWPEETRSWLWRLRESDHLSDQTTLSLLNGDLESALRLSAEAVLITEELRGGDPESLLFRLYHADALSSAARVSDAAGRAESAALLSSSAEEEWRQLAAADPQPLHAYGWAASLCLEGKLLIKRGRTEEGLELLAAAEDIADGLVKLGRSDNAAFAALKSDVQEQRRAGEPPKPEP
jgi:tetratricopeptide (TPR) repeat protein